PSQAGPWVSGDPGEFATSLNIRVTSRKVASRRMRDWTASSVASRAGGRGFEPQRPTVPDPGRPVDATRGEPMAVGPEGQADDASVVAAEGGHLLAGRRVPEFDHPVGAGRGDPFPIGAEGDLMNA